MANELERKRRQAAHQRKYYAKNRNKCIEASRKCHLAKHEEYKEYQRQYYKETKHLKI